MPIYHFLSLIQFSIIYIYENFNLKFKIKLFKIKPNFRKFLFKSDRSSARIRNSAGTAIEREIERDREMEIKTLTLMPLQSDQNACHD